MNTPVVTNMFTAEQITSITTALNTAITNVLSMFVSLLPVLATIAGVAFGINNLFLVPLSRERYA